MPGGGSCTDGSQLHSPGSTGVSAFPGLTIKISRCPTLKTGVGKGELRDLYCAVCLTHLKCSGLGFAVPHHHGNTRTRPEQLPSLSLAKPRQQQGTDNAIWWKSVFDVPFCNSVPYSNLTHFCQTSKGVFLIKPNRSFQHNSSWHNHIKTSQQGQIF